MCFVLRPSKFAEGAPDRPSPPAQWWSQDVHLNESPRNGFIFSSLIIILHWTWTRQVVVILLLLHLSLGPDGNINCPHCPGAMTATTTDHPEKIPMTTIRSLTDPEKTPWELELEVEERRRCQKFAIPKVQ